MSYLSGAGAKLEGPSLLIVSLHVRWDNVCLDICTGSHSHPRVYETLQRARRQCLCCIFLHLIRKTDSVWQHSVGLEWEKSKCFMSVDHDLRWIWFCVLTTNFEPKQVVKQWKCNKGWLEFVRSPCVCSVSFEFSDFLLQPKHKQARWIGNCKIPVGVNVSVCISPVVPWSWRHIKRFVRTSYADTKDFLQCTVIYTKHICTKH